MFRAIICGAARAASVFSSSTTMVAPAKRAFSQQMLQPLTKYSPLLLQRNSPAPKLQQLQIGIMPAISSLHQQPIRSLTKFSLIKGKRKSVKAVIKRFKRLDWGIWIRTHCGRNKKMFKKSAARRRRLKQHIFTNSTQSYLLDKMVTSFWRRPKYYIDDPYAPYHKRDEFFATKSKTFKV